MNQYLSFITGALVVLLNIVLVFLIIFTPYFDDLSYHKKLLLISILSVYSIYRVYKEYRLFQKSRKKV